ncbi:hypothetical protein K0U27_00655 [archaeon]|nr:hypothetical protein [archaeon]
MPSKKKSTTVKKSKSKKNSSAEQTVPSSSDTYPIASQKPNSKRKRPYHAVGVMQTESESQTPYHEGVYQKFPKEVIDNHIPIYESVPYSHGENPRPLSAAQIKSFRDRSKSKTFFPKFFMNPYQDLDYMVLQDIYANSIAGRIIDRKEELKFGQGIKPVLKLRDPKSIGDEDAQQKEIDDNHEIIDTLLAIDEALGDPDDAIDPFLDDDINSKFQALSKNSAVFGRAMIIKEFQRPLVLADGRSFTGIPNVLKVIHPRDIGIVEIDQASWKLKSVNVRFTGRNVSPAEMIYLEQGSNNPVYNALHYGFSEMQSMIGASRTLRQIIEVDFPTIAKHVWAGIGFMFVKPEGTTESEKQSELDQINSVARAGRLNSLMINPEDVRTDFQDFNPKINEMVQLCDFLIRYNIAQIGMPQALFAQEKDSNRSTLVQKVRFFLDGGLKNQQRHTAQQIAKQWYMPNFKAVYGKDSEIFKKFKIEAEFEPLKLEAFDDAVDAVIKLNKEFPLTAEAAGDLLGIDNFETMIDPDIPRPDPNKRGFGFTNGDGKKMNMEF